MKSTANVEATCKFSAGMLTSPQKTLLVRADDETDEAYAARDTEARRDMLKASSMEDGPEKEALYEKLTSLLPPKLKAELEVLGVRLPSDSVTVSSRLGTLFFDLYVLGNPNTPEAPLAKALHQKRIQDFAARMEEDEINLSQVEASIVRQGLQDEVLWDKLRFTAAVVVGGEKRYIVLNNKAAEAFPAVVAAAVGYLLDFDTTQKASGQ